MNVCEAREVVLDMCTCSVMMGLCLLPPTWLTTAVETMALGP